MPPDPWPAVTELIPHRPPLLMAEEVVELRPDGALCRGRVHPDSPFVTAGAAPSFVALEMAAQCAALLEALDRWRKGGAAAPRVGFLVGVRNATFAPEPIPAGRTLTIDLRAVGAAPPLTIYEARVADEGREYFSGSFSTFVGESPVRAAR